MIGVDEVWAWIYPSIEDLKADRLAEPDKPWETRRASFLDGLGLSDAGEHPVTELLLHQLDDLTDQERDELLGGDQLDTLAYELVLRCDQPAGEEDGYDGGGAGAAGPFDWVTDDQRGHLEALWGQDWQTALAADLDVRWGADWFTHPAEHKAAWLADLITTGAFTAPRERSEPPAPIPEGLAEAVTDIPGFDQLSPEEITQVIDEVLQKMGR